VLFIINCQNFNLRHKQQHRYIVYTSLSSITIPFYHPYFVFISIVMSDGYVGQWNSAKVTSGMKAGLPLTIFDKAMENTVVISPFREFMATSSYLDTDSDPHMLQLGVMGMANEVYFKTTI